MILAGILIVFVFGVCFWQSFQSQGPAFLKAYRLVPEKISQSADIPVYLPEGVDKSFAKSHIKFFPEIKGEWREPKRLNFLGLNITLAADKSFCSNLVLFHPSEKLKLNRYYLVELTTPTGQVMKSDFLVDEDPKILAVFPKENSEAPENSEITIVFNRPMVPLTRLDRLEEKEIPVEIFPRTEGRFKWVTTRNLQFIPKERLRRATNYTVKIKPGFVSMDGLKIKGAEFHFKTRLLRYKRATKGNIIYNRPISVYFNQPVDLKRTKNEIVLRDSSGKEIPFIAQYQAKEGKNTLSKDNSTQKFGLFDFKNLAAQIESIFNLNLGEINITNGERANKSVIEIYPQRDRFGRKKLWDFGQDYSLTIKKAYPLEGDIVLDKSLKTNVRVLGVIKDVRAESERTKLASSDFFDPQGKLGVEFYEDIDLKKSRILNKKIKEVGYGKKCKEGQKAFSASECEKVLDKKKIYLSFREDEINFGEQLIVNFEKIVNEQGFQINKEPISLTITSFPKFRILRSYPSKNGTNASVTRIIFCSNSPILKPPPKDYKNYLQSNLDYEINYWTSSYRVGRARAFEECKRGEFHTEINWGLMPHSDYSLVFNLKDVFGQSLNYSLQFRTGDIPAEKLNFYALQSSYNVASYRSSELGFFVQNMDYLNLEICKLDPYDFLYYLEHRPHWRQPSSFPCRERVEDVIHLPKRYWIKNYFTIDVKKYFSEPLGNYILTFSNPNYKKRYWRKGGSVWLPVFERSYLTITNLAVTEKKINPETAEVANISDLYNLYWVLDFSSLKPVDKAKITLYQGNNLAKAGEFYTNSSGIAKTPLFYKLKGVIVEKNGDSTVLPYYGNSFNWPKSAEMAEKVYIYTDKPIYRPGETVFIKGIYRVGYDGSYEFLRNRLINLKVYNSENREVFSQELNLNDYGTFNTKLVLDKKSPLGKYRVCYKHRCSSFDVQEYVPSPFKVEVSTDKEEYISKDVLRAKVKANYYFGVPLQGGKVFYALSSQNYYFDRYAGPYFEFSRRWYFWGPHRYGEKFLLRGQASLSKNGEAEIRIPLDIDRLFKNREERKSKILVLDVSVQNLQGQEVSSQKSFILHGGEFYLGVKTDKSFLGKNEKFNIQVKSVDTKGKEIKVKNGTLSLYQTNWIYSKRQDASGGYSYRWEKEKRLINSWSFDTNKKGDYFKEVQISKEGEYEIEARAKDKRGNTVFSSFTVYVWGEGYVSLKPTTDTNLEIETKKTELEVGQEAEIIVKSPYKKAKALISVERGRILDYWIREINGNLYDFKFRIKKEYFPDVFVSVLIQSSKPEVKFGQARFKINTKERSLNIKVKSDKNFYLPGEKVKLDILTTDYQDKPVSAEVSLSVVDLSVLALKGNPKKNPLVFFYGDFPLTVKTSSNVKNFLVRKDFESKTKGGGGGALEISARRVRGIFKETAFWQAVVNTDEQGRAEVSFTLPDNLTTWQAETVGVTKDTRLGVNYLEFKTKKDLMVLPLKPRFVVPGDVFYIGAKVFNQTDRLQKIMVRFESQTLNSLGKLKKEISLAPKKSETVYFKVKAPENIEEGEHRFLISADSGILKDGVIEYIKIIPNDTYEVVATANHTRNKISREYVYLPENILKNKGEVSIGTSATLAVFLSDALNYLIGYPYGCSEQISSKLRAIAVVKSTLNLPNIGEKFKLKKIKHNGKEYSIDELVQLGLSKIYNNQQLDGGFSFWRNGKSDFYLTLEVAEALGELKKAGYLVNNDVLNRALGYISKAIVSNRNLYKDKNNVILASYILSDYPDLFNAALKAKVAEIVQDDLFIKEDSSNISLLKLGILLKKGGFSSDYQKKILDVLDNRTDVDGRGLFLEPRRNYLLWRDFETTIKDTALYLKVQAAYERENPILDKTIRWLLNSRKKDGAWGSTQNTLAVLDAFSDYLEKTQETKANFDLKVLVNDEIKGRFSFNPETVLEQYKKQISINELKFNENNLIELQKTDKNWRKNQLYYDLTLRYYLPAEKVPPRDEGLSIEREVYKLEDKENKNPIREAKVGEILRVRLKVTVPKTRKFVAIEDYIPAGFEIINQDLATEQKSLRLQEKEIKGRELHPDFKEIHDDRLLLFNENLSPGVYEYEYFIRVLIPGRFIYLPARVSQMYFPEVFGRTAGGHFEIKK